MLIEKLYVHAGRPHLDNAYCAFIAETLGGKTIRVNTLPEDVDVFNYIGIIAADIGGGVYDHHGYDTPKRKDGYTHCAASLMWKWFGIDVVKELFPTCQSPDKIAKRIDREILSTIAAYDNDEGPDGIYTIYQEANSFLPTWNESSRTMEEAFQDMVDFAKKITVRVGEKAISVQQAEPIVTKALSKMENGIIVLPQFVPWQAYVIRNKDARFVVFPSDRGGWNLQGVPVGSGMRTVRCSFDKKWLGKAGAEAEELWHNMTFCHPGNFMAAFTTKHSAINAAKHLMRIDTGFWSSHPPLHAMESGNS